MNCLIWADGYTSRIRFNLTTMTLFDSEQPIIDAWCAHLLASRHSIRTVDLRVAYLRRFRHDLGRPLATATLRDLEGWMSAHQWSDNTARSAATSLRTFYAWASEEALIDECPSHRLAVVREGPPLPHPVPEAVYYDALGRSDSRAHLMLRLAGEAGCRRAEVAQVARIDLCETLGGEVDLLVHGKGGKDRLVPISKDLAEEIITACKASGWAFPSPIAGHLTPGHVGELVARALGGGWTMHALRHRYASRLYAASNDIVAVQELLGHSSVDTTRRYVAMPRDRLRAVAMLAA